MTNFWTLVKESVILQALIALILIGTAGYLWVTGTTPPDDLLQLIWAVLGFYFGAKVENVKTKGK